MLKLSLCDFSDACILAKGTISIAPVPLAAVNPNNDDKEGVFKNCTLSTDCISEISNTQVDNAKHIDVVMPMYNII